MMREDYSQSDACNDVKSGLAVLHCRDGVINF